MENLTQMVLHSMLRRNLIGFAQRHAFDYRSTYDSFMAARRVMRFAEL